MGAFNETAFFDAVRPMMGGKLTQAQVNGFQAALRAGMGTSALAYPAWTAAAMTKLGEREIKGPKHNPFIVNEMWRDLGATWLKTDDADGAWCGGMAAWSVNKAGLPYPKNYAAAASWGAWGQACQPQVGAFAVKARPGGHHVTQLVGITTDGRYYLGLGGNQSDCVCIAPIAVADVTALRWPAGVEQLHIALPVMAKTTIVSEA